MALNKCLKPVRRAYFEVKFILCTMNNDVGNRYSPRSYEEHEDGSVTITCEKSNEEMPFLGGYNVFGMSANDLEEAD